MRSPLGAGERGLRQRVAVEVEDEERAIGRTAHGATAVAAGGAAHDGAVLEVEEGAARLPAVGRVGRLGGERLPGAARGVLLAEGEPRTCRGVARVVREPRVAGVRGEIERRDRSLVLPGPPARVAGAEAGGAADAVLRVGVARELFQRGERLVHLAFAGVVEGEEQAREVAVRARLAAERDEAVACARRFAELQREGAEGDVGERRQRPDVAQAQLAIGAHRGARTPRTQLRIRDGEEIQLGQLRHGRPHDRLQGGAVRVRVLAVRGERGGPPGRHGGVVAQGGTRRGEQRGEQRQRDERSPTGSGHVRQLGCGGPGGQIRVDAVPGLSYRPGGAGRLVVTSLHIGSPFVGRESELAAVLAELAAARAGQGRVVALVGEAGIGKTRLIEQIVAAADLPSDRVLWGRCPDHDGAPAFWPWVQVLRSWAERLPDDVLAARVGAAAGTLVQLVPGLRGRLPDADAPPLDAEGGRFRVAEDVTDLLRRLAADAPLLVVLEDLHWTDPASLQLLAFAARELGGARLLVLATWREHEMGRQTALLDGLARSTRRVALGGLARDDTARWMHAVTGRALAPTLVADVHRTTEGNPFFLGEFVRMLESEGGLDRPDLASLGVKPPGEVRATLRRRLAPLDVDDRRLLEIAAVVGREFDVALVATASERPLPAVFERLTSGGGVGLVEPMPDSLARFRFVHALVRETLYGDLSLAQRAQLHRRIGRALEAASAGTSEPPLGELASHFFHAAPLGDVETALDYAERAGIAARVALGWEEAAGHFERALQLLALRPPDDPRRMVLLLGHGDAVLRAGDAGRACDIFAEAARVARSAGDPVGLAVSALRYLDARGPVGAVDPTAVALLEQARDALGSEEGPLRAMVLVALAVARYFSGAVDDGLALVDEALAMARRLGDWLATARALQAKHYLLLGPNDPMARHALAEEAARLATEAGDGSLAFLCRVYGVNDLLTAGDVAAAEREVEALGRDADAARLPHRRWLVHVLRGGLAILAGRYEEAQRLAARALELRRDGQDAGALQAFWLQSYVARRELGPPGEPLEAAIARMADEFPAIRAWRAASGLLHAREGRRDLARRDLELLATRDFAGVPRDVHYLPTLTTAAELAAVLGDVARSAQLYALLLPFAGWNVVSSIWSPAVTGAVDRYLGLTAATAGDAVAAARHLADAIAVDTRMGARGQAAHARHELGALLLRRGGSGQRDEAQRLLADARDIAAELGMQRLLEELDAVAREAAPRAAAPVRTAVASAVDAGRAVLRRREDEWEIGLAGATVRVKDAKGLTYLATLLRAPGREVHVLDLIGGSADPAPAPLADPATRDAYRSRLADLRDELEEAERFHDAGRAERAHAEMEFLVAELTRATSRPDARGGGAAAERARVNVTRALGRAVERIASIDAALGQHLTATLRTGLVCSYAPDPRLRLGWEL